MFPKDDIEERNWTWIGGREVFSLAFVVNRYPEEWGRSINELSCYRRTSSEAEPYLRTSKWGGRSNSWSSTHQAKTNVYRRKHLEMSRNILVKVSSTVATRKSWALWFPQELCMCTIRITFGQIANGDADVLKKELQKWLWRRLKEAWQTLQVKLVEARHLRIFTK